ncbi:MAG: hypothetical protein ACXQS8_04825 [Candidatus Helarchaeales archaeon]
MVSVVISFLGVLQRKVNTREVKVLLDGEKNGISVRKILEEVIKKLPGDKERSEFKKWVFDPARPDNLNKEMAYILNGRHLKPSKESLEMKVNGDQELVIFPPEGGG